MGRFFTLIIALLFSIASWGQAPAPPASGNTAISPYEWTGQMLNTANTYVGSRLDTATNTTALYLSVTKISAGLPVLYPLFGNGSLSILVSGIKISGTCTATITVEKSYDGVLWGPVHTSNTPVPASTLTGSVTTTYTNTAPDAFSVTDIATVQAYTWDFPFLWAPYWRVKILGTNTQTSSWKAQYCFNRTFYYTGR